ncbi:MAG: hypothetical protein GEU83_02805 [Pseudonocardiaceae bacterium]|nr:hypothetical protein [Pseudonocardiaceae bacterium]
MLAFASLAPIIACAPVPQPALVIETDCHREVMVRGALLGRERELALLSGWLESAPRRAVAARAVLG